ncbi:SAP30-binding protein isoform X2 [Cynoglossus semilaevis]|uniref:SAP30-binding protein isoform X2 n=1 Tax=Cynoglossus semilaevis TaxID=244447 RepID=UPI000495FEC0|nr:SAP30-binding protein isoform X2 [Cynoglossus semilaevis]
MASAKKKTPLSSLVDYVDDSEADSDSETEETGGAGTGLVYGYRGDDLNTTEDQEEKISGDEDSKESNSEVEESDEGRDADDVEISEAEKKDPNELVALFSEKVRSMSPDEIRMPPEPPGRCSSQLQDKIHKLYGDLLRGDLDINSHIQKKKEFRNPSIYEKLIQFSGIDEVGTNYPKDMFDPHGWSEDSYYEALAKAQKVEMDKLDKAKKERTKIEFVTGTKKGTNPSNTAASTNNNSTTTTATEAQKRKSKWDSAIPVTLAQPTLITTTATLPAVVSVTTTASGTKTTVISAVGTILKKAKQ